MDDAETARRVAEQRVDIRRAAPDSGLIDDQHLRLCRGDEVLGLVPRVGRADDEDRRLLAEKVGQPVSEQPSADKKHARTHIPSIAAGNHLRRQPDGYMKARNRLGAPNPFGE